MEGDTLGGGSLPSDCAIQLWAGMHKPVVFAKLLAAKKFPEDEKASRWVELSTIVPVRTPGC